jgi:hypothetical protein
LLLSVDRMPLILYVIFVGIACAYALRDWRGAWLLVIVCGVIQDPVRKLTSQSPVAISFLVVGLFGTILVAGREEMIANVRDFARRFGQLYTAIVFFLFTLVIAGVNGLVTYGFDKWKVPILSFATYFAPLLAILLGYAWFQREEMIFRFFRIYAAATSVALIGSILEYVRVQSRIIGMVSFEGDIIRHLPGIQIRMLSGFYRSPDLMAWHAATLTAIGIMMALRSGFGKEMFIWTGVAGWGFVNCMLAGRRKALYYIATFCLAFLWRYITRIKTSQVFALLGIVVILGAVVRNIASNEDTSVYTRGALATRGEIAERLEGGLMETLRQFGLMGAGLGTATQGVRHLLGTDENLGWQEGGLGKFAIEVGIPGLLMIAAIAYQSIKLLLRLTAIGDVQGSSQFVRASLFAFVVANAAAFTASAQAYSDAVLALTAGFFVGALFATAALDERLQQATVARVPRQQLTSPAPA